MEQLVYPSEPIAMLAGANAPDRPNQAIQSEGRNQMNDESIGVDLND